MKLTRKNFISSLLLGGIPLVTFGKGSSSLKEKTSSVIDIADNCDGEGNYPKYKNSGDDNFKLVDAGSPRTHKDGSLGLKDIKGEFDAKLENGAYAINQAIEMREPASIRGERTGFGNPNGEYPPINGTVIRFEKAGIKVGRKTRFSSHRQDDRMSNGEIENLCLYRNTEKKYNGEFGDGAAIWTDLPSDQFTINKVNITCSTYGVLNTSYIDAFRIRALHTGRVTFPLYFADKSENNGQMTAAWYGTVSDCIFADGDGPVVIKGGSQPWQFSNVIIVRQGRTETHIPTCNLFWNVNNGRFDAGVIDAPGQMFRTFDGGYERKGYRIPADGMILTGNRNTITTFFKNANGEGKANLRLAKGSNNNIINSQFGGVIDGAVDVIIEEDCENNVIYASPGMKIIDRGTNTAFIGKELAEYIKS